MTDRLHELKARPERRVIGLNCGTSRDGVDAAMVRIFGHGFGARFVLDGYLCHPLPAGIVPRLADPALDPAAICRLDWELGEAFADAAQALLGSLGLDKKSVDLVGSHGLTLWHAPARRRGETGSTLQIGRAAVLAERLGCPVVSDFRSADMAAGGQGAPLMPYLDYLMFRQSPGTLLLNLGGIANLSWIGAAPEEVLAFDTGPANLPLDRLASILSKGESSYDDRGRLAAMGHVDPVLLGQLLQHPFVLARPPKSTGREEFGDAFVDRLLASHRHMKLIDLQATLTAFSAHAVKRAVDDWIRPRDLVRILVSGGGVKNLTLMRHLQRLFDPVPTQSFAEVGFDPDAKEALLFALLANERLHDHPANIPSATGARWPVSLGTIIP